MTFDCIVCNQFLFSQGVYAFDGHRQCLNIKCPQYGKTIHDFDCSCFENFVTFVKETSSVDEGIGPEDFSGSDYY